MKLATKLFVCLAVCTALTSNPASAESKKKAPKPFEAVGAPQATFYELTETMQLLTARRGGQARVATSALSGTAEVGTIFCPSALAYSVMADPKQCSIVAIGKDNVSLTTGLGTFQATLDIVVQGDNPVDGPEFLVAEMKVLGKMDFSPAILSGFPYGTVAGSLDTRFAPLARPRFIGVFRLPFLASAELKDAAGNTIYVAPNVPMTARMALCGFDSQPNPYLPGWDIAYVDTTPTGKLTGTCSAIRPEELALGVPTVKFDLWFE